MGNLALRAALVWNGEVMADHVLDGAGPITIGQSGKTTFVTPPLPGLDADYAIVRPGTSGYLLVLARGMTGTVSVGGVQHSVEELLASEDFHAVSIFDGDWGVVELSESSKLFFQFVPREERVVIATRQQLMVGGIGFGVFSLIGSIIWMIKGIDFAESIARGIGVTALMFGLAWLGRAVSRQNGESQASLGFSIALHTAILLLTFQVYAQESAMAALPPQNDLMATYTVTRPAESMPILIAVPKQVMPTIRETTPPPIVDPHPIVVPTQQPIANPAAGGGRSGRKGDGAQVSEFGMLGNPALKGLVAKQVGANVNTLANVDGTGEEIAGPPGNGKPQTRGDDGDPKNPAGGPISKTTKTTKIELRKAGICLGQCGGGTPVSIDPPPTTTTDDGPTLTMKDVNDGVRKRQGYFKACYQKKLNLNGELTGTVVMRFSIRDGRVTSASIAGGTLKDGDVTQCMLTGIQSLQFPPYGAAKVTYPFAFSVGG